MLESIHKDDKNEFRRVVNKLKDVGFESSTNLGFSIGLEDLEVQKNKRDSIFAKADKEIAKASPSKKDETTIKEYMKATNELEKFLESHYKGGDNAFYQMMDSGARGKMNQIRQILGAPVLVQDVTGKTLPMPIKKSYSEGLEMGDYWSTMSGARKGIMDRALSTAMPGYFAKELVNSNISYKVDSEDCGTKSGRSMSTDNWDIVGRYLAKDQNGYKRNFLITSDSLTQMKKKSKTWIVRSPQSCVRPMAICASCFGLRETGERPQLGDDIGVLAAQTVSEPSTQLTMKSFHTGGTADSGGGITSGFKRVSQIMELPEILKGSGTMSSVNGVIKNIEKNPSGGWNIDINDEPHFVQQGRNLEVKKGQSVNMGDRLSDGPLRPQDILTFRGLEKTQDYLRDEMSNAFSSQGINIKDRIFETIIKPMTNNAKIRDPGNSKKWVAGDWAPLNEVVEFNDKTDNKVKFDAQVTGINMQPLQSNDWVTRMNWERLQETLIEGASQGWTSDIKGGTPVAEYIFGPMHDKMIEKSAAGGYEGMSPSEERVDDSWDEVKVVKDAPFETENKSKPGGPARGNKNPPFSGKKIKLHTKNDMFNPSKDGHQDNAVSDKLASTTWTQETAKKGLSSQDYINKINNSNDYKLLSRLSNPGSEIRDGFGKIITGPERGRIVSMAKSKLTDLGY
jgi:DNA-directed RNA polymerase subunit beta'